MVMQYWAGQAGFDGAAADAEKIDEALPPSSKGVTGEALKGYLESHGFSAYVFSGELSDLRDHITKGRPVVVCLGLKGPKGPLHFVVVAGVEDRAVILNDPTRGKLFREEMDPFLRAWKATRNWAMLAVPRQTP
jgi:predicted double-glycine peptidase